VDARFQLVAKSSAALIVSSAASRVIDLEIVHAISLNHILSRKGDRYTYLTTCFTQHFLRALRSGWMGSMRLDARLIKG